MNILIVDDHYLARHALRDWLYLQNFVSHEADSFQAAQVICHNCQFDVAIIDIVIPREAGSLVIPTETNQNGLELGLWLRTQQPNCRIIFISADPTLGTQVQETFVQMGNHGVAYLLKASAQPEKLLIVMQRVLAKEIYIDPAVKYQRYPATAQVFLDRIPAEERQWVEAVHQRLSQFKPHHLAVLHLAVQGHKQKSIAHQLGFKENTVEKYLAEANEIAFPDGVRPFVRPLVILGYAFMLQALCDEAPQS